MEEQVERLVKKTWDQYKALPNSKRLLVGIAGIPGSGKTTLAATVTSRLNQLYHDESPGCAMGGAAIAAFVPMDGYHLTRAQLSAMPDPATAHARRGAAFTFDGPAFLALVRRLREPLTPETTTFFAPSFDHAVKDPVADDVPIRPAHRVVMFEGNYVALDKEPWSQAADLMDELWFVDVDFGRARERLVRRHVAAGIARDEKEAGERADKNDLVNAKEIVEGKVPGITEVVVSREDEDWAPEKHGVGVAN